MTRDYMINRYFNWMYDLVCVNRYSKRLSYRKLLNYLFQTDFIYIIGLDSNRAEDGVNLRYRFGHECGYADVEVSNCLDDRECSVLEMMVALSNRCEEHIMDDPDIGNRTGQWFWDMIENLELDTMSDTMFDERYVDEVIERLLNREYGRHGEGGLFLTPNCRYDLRSEEIWYQAMWYLDSIIKN